MNILFIAAVPDPRDDPAWYEPDQMRAIDVREGFLGVIRLILETASMRLFIMAKGPGYKSLARMRLPATCVQTIDEDGIGALDPKKTIVFFVGGTDTEMRLFDRLKHWPHVFPIASTGKAAAAMLDELGDRLPRNLVSLLRRETVYGHVARMVYTHVTAS